MGGATADIHNRFMIFRLISYVGNHRKCPGYINFSLHKFLTYTPQCHRGFIVNLNFVEKLQCENNSYFLNLFYVDKKIPVSRSKKADIKAALSALQR